MEIQSYTILDGGSPERMMAVIVISNSDSDSEFERDVQEVTRQSLMIEAPSPVREVRCVDG